MEGLLAVSIISLPIVLQIDKLQELGPFLYMPGADAPSVNKYAWSTVSDMVRQHSSWDRAKLTVLYLLPVVCGPGKLLGTYPKYHCSDNARPCSSMTCNNYCAHSSYNPPLFIFLTC